MLRGLTPEMRGAVVLEEIAVAFSLPSAAGFGATFEGLMEQFEHVRPDMLADVGSGAFETEATEEFVG